MCLTVPDTLSSLVERVDAEDTDAMVDCQSFVDEIGRWLFVEVRNRILVESLQWKKCGRLCVPLLA